MLAGYVTTNAFLLIMNDLPYAGKGAMAAVGIGWQSVGYHSR
jgi:hypothetical protein